MLVLNFRKLSKNWTYENLRGIKYCIFGCGQFLTLLTYLLILFKMLTNNPSSVITFDDKPRQMKKMTIALKAAVGFFFDRVHSCFQNTK